MRLPAPIPPRKPPHMRCFWTSLALLTVGAISYAFAPAMAPVLQRMGAGENPASVVMGVKTGDAAKAAYPKKQNQIWNTPGEISAWQSRRVWHKAGSWSGNETWAGARATDWETEHRTWPERGGYRGRMIGYIDFHRFFGEANPFRLWLEPKVKNGYPQFSHAGNKFRIVDPYPEDWSPSWFRGKQVHVTYDRGYYLHRREHPEFPIAVMVVY